MNAETDNTATLPDLAVLDYGMGNLRSVLRAWERVGGKPRLVDQPGDLGKPDALVFPGQGAIVDAIRLLRERGFDRLIKEWIEADRPFFGICLGLQALFEHSEEGDTPGLGVFPGEIVRFNFGGRRGTQFKVPHMGWNNVTFLKDTPLNPAESEQFYFVHSYYCSPTDDELVWGETTYGGITFASAVTRGRCYATQFHPEKSQRCGLELYRRFLQGL